MKYWHLENAVRKSNVKLNGIDGVTSRYWYYLSHEGNVIDECSWWE
jgi:hypothetical protein